MKRAVVAVLGMLVFCGVYLSLFRSHLGLGILLLPAVVVAFFIAHLCSAVGELRKRVQLLEERLSCGGIVPEEPQAAAETAAEKLERLYRGYSDKKLQKVLESAEYREDAKKLAQQILKEREEVSGAE